VKEKKFIQAMSVQTKKNMKDLLLILITVFMFSPAFSQTTKTYYTCVMHPEIRQDKPGNCPKCGMTLIKKTVKFSTPKPTPKKEEQKPTPKPVQSVQQEEHKGMDMDKSMQQKPKPEQPQSKVVYTCVMHPEVQMDKPGNCPKCGMKLIKKTIKVPAKKTADVKGEGKQMDMDMQGGNHNMDEMNMNSSNSDEVVGSKVNLQAGRTVRYDLHVTDTIVNYTGKRKHAYAVNGSIPAPTLYFTEGDTAEIYLHNNLKKEQTSLHWHGVILPNRFDGVPYLTTAPIHPGETHLYKFRIVQNGTYWYHSHTALQEQQGMYGALIFKKREQPPVMNASMSSNNNAATKHYNVVLSEWSDENPAQTQRRFRTGNDWFSIKKGSTQSYGEAIKEGYFNTKLQNEWKRMKAMDVSDDWYQKFLINGKPETTEQQFKAGDKINLHVVNAGSSTYFWLGYGGGKISVVGNDGNELQPIEVDRLIIAPAETYDLVVTVPENMSYEFRATSEDRTGASSLWLGTGMKMPAPKLPRLKYFEGMKMMNAMMRTNGTMKSMNMNMGLQQMDMNTVMYPEITGGTGDTTASGNNNPEKQLSAPSPRERAGGEVNNMQHSNMAGMAGMDMSDSSDIVTLNYSMMKAPYNTALPDGPMKTIHFNLTGNMNRYVWTLDNKTVNEADRILIQKGENVRIILTNNSMMRHPMHLHGHDFRVLNGQGDYAPLKNVIDIMPMETDTIEFAANQEGNWFFHCHILFHMMAGMGRVFTYENSPVNPELPEPKKAEKMFKMDNNMVHLMARVGLESNGSDGEAMLSTNRYAVVTNWRLGLNPHHGYESETYFGRYIGVNQWLFPYVGFDYHYNNRQNVTGKNFFGQSSNQNNRRTFTAGIQYTTPGLFLADARIDGKGKFRFQLGREGIPITQKLRFNIMGNTDKEYMAGFRYVLNKWSSLSTHYDSDMKFGAGLTITY
jgi:CopA family copper-resistance protein